MERLQSYRIAVVGAGPSGLSQLRAFALKKLKGEPIPDIVCFEKQSEWGGMWNYTWRTGTDEYGEPVHGSMYRNLWTNAPKECHEFADYSFDHHFSKPIPSFIPREMFRDYILGRAEQSSIRQYIQFNTIVRYVERDSKKGFTVRTENLLTKKSSDQHFDYVIVAVGHFSVPNIPYFPGIETFPGQVVHSHDFRDARQLTGQRVLVVGGSVSAEDIALQAFKFGAKSVTISYRTKPMGFQWPSEIKEKSLLTEIKERIVYFSDKSNCEFDSIVLCTGYMHHFPFLADNLRLETKNCLYPSQLYKGIFFQDHPDLMYLGMQNLFFSLSLFDAQAWYIRDVVVGKIKLPGKSDRALDIRKWKSREEKITEKCDAIDFQSDYVQELTDATDYPFFSVLETSHIFKKWISDKTKSILNFRDVPYTSPITGTRAARTTVSWLDARNDSIAKDE